jgi:16S rRNA processing protein RimM
MTEELVTLGRIIGLHGLAGEVAVRTENDDPAAIGRYASVLWLAPRAPERRLTITAVRVHRGAALVSFAEVPDRTAAEALLGGRLAVPLSERLPAPDGQYYVADLIGLTVVTTTGEEVGRLTGVYESGAHDIYGVDRGGTEVLIPAVEQFIRSVDMEKRVMIVDPPEGLFE